MYSVCWFSYARAGGRSLAGLESPRFRHGWYTREAIAERRAIAALIANSRETICRIEGET